MSTATTPRPANRYGRSNRAGGEQHSRIAVDLPVREPLVSGRIYGCSENLPFYMDPESSFYAAR